MTETAKPTNFKKLLIETGSFDSAKNRNNRHFSACGDNFMKQQIELLKTLRKRWMDDRDEFLPYSREWLRLHFGVYALDEAIRTLENDEIFRYKENNISLDSMLKRGEGQFNTQNR